MREETVKIYKFDELSEDVQETVIDNNRDWNVDSSHWYEFNLDNWKERLACIGFEDAEINFGHMFCQGEGASFTSIINTEKIFSYMVYNETENYTDIGPYEKMMQLQDLDMIEFSFGVTRNSHMYSHENTCSTRYEIDLYLENCSSAGEDWFYKEIDMFTDVIESIRHELCQDIMFSLKEEYEYLTSDDSIKESIECNEIEFIEDGTIY